MSDQIKASGFVVQPRLQFKKLIDKMIYQYLLDNANYIKSEKCDVGQTILVLTDLSKETGWTRETIRGALNRLEKDGYIIAKPRHQKKGMDITINFYKELQSLPFYKSDKGKKSPQENTQEIPQQETHENDSENAWGSKGENMSKKVTTQEKAQGNPHEIPHTITAFINSIKNINKTLKEYIVDAPVKNKNLGSLQDIETFVDFAARTNALPNGVNTKLLISYFDCIRLTRGTCTISANILVKFIEKMSKYSINQIHYALWKHIEQHDDKRESYTLGIMRNTNEHEARRGLIKLKNKGAEPIAAHQQDQKYDYGF